MPHPRNVARHYIGWLAYSSELRESVSVTGITGWPEFPFFGPPLTAGGMTVFGGGTPVPVTRSLSTI